MKTSQIALPDWTRTVDLNGLWALQKLASDCVQRIRSAPSAITLFAADPGTGLLGPTESEAEIQLRETLRKSSAADEFRRALANDGTHLVLLSNCHYADLISCLDRHATAERAEKLKRPEALACLTYTIAGTAFSFLIEAEACSSEYRLTPTKDTIADARKFATALLELRRQGLYEISEFFAVRKSLERFLPALSLAEPGARGRKRTERATPDQVKLRAAQRFQAALEVEFPKERAFRIAALNKFRAFVGYSNCYAVPP